MELPSQCVWLLRMGRSKSKLVRGTYGPCGHLHGQWCVALHRVIAWGAAFKTVGLRCHLSLPIPAECTRSVARTSAARRLKSCLCPAFSQSRMQAGFVARILFQAVVWLSMTARPPTYRNRGSRGRRGCVSRMRHDILDLTLVVAVVRRLVVGSGAWDAPDLLTTNVNNCQMLLIDQSTRLS